MSSLMHLAVRLALLVCVGFTSMGCKVSGEFDPDLGRKDKDRDTVYRTSAPLPQ
jgi:hypothetical protein